MKLTIFSKREYKFKGRDGSDVHGFMYAGFTEKGSVIEFSSQNSSIPTNEGVVEYDAGIAADIQVKASVFGGKVKYSQIPAASA